MRVVALTLTCAVVSGLATNGPVGAFRAQPVLNFVGVTAHNWGTWVEPGTEVDDWLNEARSYCAGEALCDVRVFEGPELATHEYPVPEANRAALRWVLTYREGESPPLVIEEIDATSGNVLNRRTYER